MVDDSTTDCKRNEIGVSWNQQGPAGPPGAIPESVSGGAALEAAETSGSVMGDQE